MNHLNDQELREQCRKEAEAKYPAPPYEPMPEGLDEIFAPDVRYTKQFAYAEALFTERKSNRELVQALVNVASRSEHRQGCTKRTWTGTHFVTSGHKECNCGKDAALALASSKGFTPTQR